MNWLKDTCRWCFVEVPETETVAAMGTVAMVLVLFGVTLIAAAYRDSRRITYPRWHPRRFLPPGFGFWLGIFMLYDALIEGVLITWVVRSPGGVEAWVVLLFVGFAFVAIASAVSWGRERGDETRQIESDVAP